MLREALENCSYKVTEKKVTYSLDKKIWIKLLDNIFYETYL